MTWEKFKVEIYDKECPHKKGGLGVQQNYQGSRQQLHALQAEPKEDPAPAQQEQQRQRCRKRLPTQARAYALRQRQPGEEQGNQEQDNLAGKEPTNFYEISMR
ncbi:hypothetical protein AAHA92_16284 [Salvia divinorum]|uniref:Uncharacterized protein n=1 Tax=Salvia divinorum TaxID=28513 RepID=A0ABD1GV24_SALDI